MASIKGQCAIDNFYGWHADIEKALGIMEARAATLLRDISAKKELPILGTLEWQELLIFIALQSSRTQLSGQESDDMADYYFKIMHQYEANKQGIKLDSFRVGSQFPAALPMQVALQAYPELNSLAACLLVNKSRVPFLSSDNPVIFYNSRFSDVDYIGVIGLTSQGLQVIYPIDERLCILLYDPEAYRRPSNTFTKVLRQSDVIQINLLHYLWSGDVVYWSSAAIDPVVIAIRNYCDPFLPFERAVNRESDHVDLEDENKGALLHSWRAHAPIEADFKFIRPNTELKPSANLIRGVTDVEPSPGGRQYVFSVEAPPRRQMHRAKIQQAIHAISGLVDNRS